MTTLPYKNSNKTKKKQVEEMFDNISSSYDLLNHLLSANIDKLWRKRAIEKLIPLNPEKILDIATGTGDFAIAAAKKIDANIIGLDLSEGMLKIGRAKINKKGLSNRVKLLKGDSEELPFESEFFNAATVGFGVRNFENLNKGLTEILRVLKPGGIFIVLEFSKPQRAPFKQFYFFYFKRILPLLGKIISKDSNAYSYLPESVNTFPEGNNFVSILKEIGFVNNRCYTQTFGIASIYMSVKPEN